MKRYIKNSTSNYNLVITIEYSISDSSYNKISASENLEDYIPNSVYAKYDAFIINMENAFAKAGFIISENHSTNRTNSLSEYYAIYPANKHKKPIYTILIVLRVSDHKLKRGEKHGYNYYDKYAQENKYPESKQYQEWQFEQILLNDHSCKSYQDAILEVKQLISKWIDNSSDNGLIII